MKLYIAIGAAILSLMLLVAVAFNPAPVKLPKFEPIKTTEYDACVKAAADNYHNTMGHNSDKVQIYQFYRSSYINSVCGTPYKKGT